MTNSPANNAGDDSDDPAIRTGSVFQPANGTGRRRHGRPGRPIPGIVACKRRPRGAGYRDGTGGARSGHREHPLLHAEKPLCAADPGPHGPARRWNATWRRCGRPARRKGSAARSSWKGRSKQLRDAVRDFVERNLLLYAKGETEKFREELLKSTRLSNLERRDLDRMRVLVRQMAKKLAARYAKTRRRRLRGQLDTRRTLRRNMGWGGIPFITVWKQKRIEKPRVMVLCDVSGSVAAMSQFLLMFMYAINEALSDIRSFAFAGSLMEVSEILEKEPVEEAISKIMPLIGFGSSNYGNSFADFEDGWMQFVTNKTTVIILGDARGNRTDPRTDVHWAAVATVQADHLVEPGIPVGLGNRRFRTCIVTRRSAIW